MSIIRYNNVKVSYMIINMIRYVLYHYLFEFNKKESAEIIENNSNNGVYRYDWYNKAFISLISGISLITFISIL
jgi:hypothetical protein